VGRASPIVVGVDGTLPAIRAARWAAAVADKFAAPLSIVHADPCLGRVSSAGAGTLRAIELAEHRAASDAILQTAQHAVRTDFPALEVTTLQLCSPVDEALCDLSRQARLVVLGCDDVSLGTALLVGSTTVAVAMHSACPVLAWRGDAVAPTDRGIVLGVGGVDDPDAAIAAAFEFADRFAVGITAVHAWTMRRPPGDVTIPYLINWDEIEGGERRYLADRLAPWITRYPSVDVACVVDPDKPSRVLLHHAKEAQLVVIGSRGRGLFAGALLGSTGLNLLHHSAVPVMICRPVGD